MGTPFIRGLSELRRRNKRTAIGDDGSFPISRDTFGALGLQRLTILYHDGMRDDIISLNIGSDNTAPCINKSSCVRRGFCRSTATFVTACVPGRRRVYSSRELGDTKQNTGTHDMSIDSSDASTTQ